MKRDIEKLEDPVKTLDEADVSVEVTKRAKVDSEESKPEAAAACAETEPVAKDSESKPETETEVSEVKPAEDEKPETSETSKPVEETKSESKPESKPESEPATESESKPTESEKPTTEKESTAKQPFKFGGSAFGSSAFGGSSFGGSSFGQSTSGFSGFSGFSSFGKLAGSKSDAKDTDAANPWAETSTSTSTSTPSNAATSAFKGSDADKEPAASEDKYVVVNLKETETTTGEENERAVFTSKARLYDLNLKEASSGWKERGLGVLKLNLDTEDRLRLVMRADGLLRVILNLPIVMNTGISKGFKASMAPHRFVRLTSIDEGSPHQYALKLPSAEAADQLFDLLAQREETKIEE